MRERERERERKSARARERERENPEKPWTRCGTASMIAPQSFVVISG
jgi:hypothetical protein